MLERVARARVEAWVAWYRRARTVVSGVVLALKRGWPVFEGRGSDACGLTIGGAPGSERRFDRYGRRVWPGIALYYAVLAFNLVVTGWIGEWVLLGVGTAVHAVTAAILWNLALRPAARLGLEKQRA